MNATGLSNPSDDVRSGAAPMIAEASRRLQSVSGRLRSFLQQKLKQFEAVSLQCEEIMSQRDEFVQMKEGLLREQGEWERRRQAQIEEFRTEQERLIAAWQKLEEEQRQVIVQQETMHLQGEHVTGSGVDAFMPSFGSTLPAAPANAASPFAPKTGGVFAEPKHYHGPAAATMSRESALEQFQRLKREIQKHVQRLQESPCGNGNANH